MLEGSNTRFSFTDLRPINRDISHEISERHLQSQTTLQNRLLCHLYKVHDVELSANFHNLPVPCAHWSVTHPPEDDYVRNLQRKHLI